MIHVFPASFVRQSNGKIGSRTITVEIDDLHRELSKEIGNSVVGTQFLIVAYEIGENKEEIADAHSNPAATRNLLMKQLHARLGEFSEQYNVPADNIKAILRQRLIDMNLIKKSTSELDESGLAHAVFILTTQLHPARYNYEQN